MSLIKSPDGRVAVLSSFTLKLSAVVDGLDFEAVANEELVSFGYKSFTSIVVGTTRTST